MAGLAQPLRMVAKILGPEQLQVTVISLEQALDPQIKEARFWSDWYIALFVADDEDDEVAALPAEHERFLIACCRQAKVWGAVGALFQKNLPAVFFYNQCIQDEFNGEKYEARCPCS